MRIDEHPESGDEYEAANLVKFVRNWLIWRGRKIKDKREVPGCWCATLRAGSRAGVDPTVVCDSADQLAEALREQASEAEAIR